MYKERVAYGFVNNTIEDVRKEFALFILSVTY